MTGLPIGLKPLPTKALEGPWMNGRADIPMDGPVKTMPLFERLRFDLVEPMDLLPYQSVFVVKFLLPTEHGLPHPSEEQKLSDLEDMLTKEIEQSSHGALFCVRTFNGIREFIFYTQIEIAALVMEIAKYVPEEYEITFESSHDPEWTEFFEIKNMYASALEQSLEPAEEPKE